MTLRALPEALRDIDDQADYFAEVSIVKLAARWRRSVNSTIESLQAFPESGPLFGPPGTRWESLRRLPVAGFPNHFLFYEYDRATEFLLILRVAHGAREFAPLQIENPDDPE